MPETKESTDTSPPLDDGASQPGQVIFQPTRLVLAGQEIHALTPNSPSLYSLSLGISNISEISSEVKLSRVEPNRDGSGRERHIYDLRRMRSVPGGWEKLPSDSPRYFIQRASSRVPGPAALGIKKSHSLMPGKAAHSTAVPVDVSGKSSKYGIPTFDKDGVAVFATNGREWTDAQGNAVAVMHDDKTDKQHTLIVTAALPRAQFDMLVALWCCHVWELTVANAEKAHEGISGVMRKMRQAREFGFAGASGPVGGGGAGF